MCSTAGSGISRPGGGQGIESCLCGYRGIGGCLWVLSILCVHTT
jgi:hypothetical protein